MTPSRDDPRTAGRSRATVADVHEPLERWQAWSGRARAAEASARLALVEGRDPRGAVTVRIDERWRVVAVRLRNTWRDVIDPAYLGTAVMEAVADAAHERLRPVIEVLADVDALPGVELSAALAGDDADLGNELTRLPGLRAFGRAPLAIDAVEAQLAEVDRQLTKQAAAQPPIRVVGWSRRREVEVELDLMGLPVRIDCRGDWVRVTTVDRLTSALAEAFVDAYAAADDRMVSIPLDGAA